MVSLRVTDSKGLPRTQSRCREESVTLPFTWAKTLRKPAFLGKLMAGASALPLRRSTWLAKNPRHQDRNHVKAEHRRGKQHHVQNIVGGRDYRGDD